MINKNLINYPSPIISVKNGFVTDKNYSARSIFHVVQVGALVSAYTNIDFSKEQMTTGLFCNVTCTYCTIFEDDETLLFIFTDAFNEASLTKKIFERYKKRVAEIENNTEIIKETTKKKYAKLINDSIIKCNFFNTFRSFIQSRIDCGIVDKDIRGSLSKVFSAAKFQTTSMFEDVNLDFDIDHLSGTLITDTSENFMLGIILNSMAFCAINTTSDVLISLSERNGIALLSYSFNSDIAFDAMLNPEDDSILNSSMSLIFATEIANSLNYKYTITKTRVNKKTSKYTLTYTIPVKVTNELTLSSFNDTDKLVRRMISIIFFDSVD